MNSRGNGRKRDADREVVAPVAATVKGWKAYRFSNAFVRMDIVPAIGGRVMGFDFDGKQFLWMNPDLAGRKPPESGTGPNGEWLNYGGDKLWLAPQGWDNPGQWPGPPDVVLDGRPHAARVIGRRLRLTSAPDVRSGIQFIRTVALGDRSTRVRFEVIMRNVDTKPRRWGIWEHAQLDGGLADGTPNQKLKSYCPLNPHSHFKTGYAVLFGADDNPAWQADTKNGLFTAAYSYTVGKAVLDSVAGWVATVDGTCGKAFVQRFVHEPGREYPDGATVEFWHSGRGSFRAWGKENVMPDDPTRNPCVVEPELISPFFQLQPGAAATWCYEWCAANIGGEHAVVGCTSAGVVVRPLTVRVADRHAHLAGHWGVFDQGHVRGIWAGRDKHQLAEFDLGVASPGAAFVLDKDIRCPAGAASVVVELVGSSGGSPGELGRVCIPRS